MKRRLFAILMVAILLVPVLSGCKKNSELTKITLNEVAHSIFYAPQYVAIEEGYFKDEGLDINLVTGFGADKTMTAVLCNRCILIILKKVYFPKAIII